MHIRICSAEIEATSSACSAPTLAILAGGTDLLALMKDDVVTPKRVVNIKDVGDSGRIWLRPRWLRNWCASSPRRHS